jgi:hypothetical protein
MAHIPDNTPGTANHFFSLAGCIVEVCLLWPETFQRTVDLLLFNNFRTNPAAPDLTMRILAVDEKNATVTPQDYSRLDPGISNRIHWECPLFHYREFFEFLQRNEHGLDSIYFEGRPGFLLVYNILKKEIFFFAKENWRDNLHFQRSSPQLFSPFLALEQGFLLHSSGVVRGNGAAIFLAPDGGGKTTVARSVPSEGVLCDDHVILKYEQPRFWAYPSPWGRISGRQAAAPVQGLFFIEKAGSFRVTRIHPAECIERIWDDNSWKLALLPAEMRSQVFDLVCKAAREIKSYRLETLPDAVDWAVIDECLANGA